MVAIKLALCILIVGGFKKCHIIIWSDNQGIVGALKAGQSCGTQQNLILHKIIKLIQDNKLCMGFHQMDTYF
jgi:hypothetical protein